MLRITIELVPYGDESRKRVLGIGEITNDAMGTHTTGNYHGRLSKWAPKTGQTWRRGTVTNFKRKAHGPWDLVYLALAACVGDRNGGVT